MTTRLVEMSRTLHARLKTFFDAPLDAGAAPLDVLQSVVDQLERKLRPDGNGRRVFPYNRVSVRLGPAFSDRPALQAVFDRLHERLVQRLVEQNCEPPADLDVSVTFLDCAPVDWPAGKLFSVDCTVEARTADEREDEIQDVGTIVMTVLKGAASQETFTFTQGIVTIGRTTDPVDDLGRVRHNDVAFLDVADGVTETVARAHARLEYDRIGRVHRVFNESASNPTCVRRRGTTIAVPPRDPRGVRVRPGDEIMLGRAAVKVDRG